VLLYYEFSSTYAGMMFTSSLAIIGSIIFYHNLKRWLGVSLASSFLEMRAGAQQDFDSGAA